MKNKIPNDPMICLSFVNTKLRDQYSSLELFCEDYETERSQLEEKLEKIGFHYDETRNCFL